MPKPIPTEFVDLFEKKAFAHLATVMPDGSPQVSPVWVKLEGEHVIVNSARGRQKDRNMQRNDKVALSIQDPDNPYRYILIRGRVAEVAEESADAVIDSLAKKYIGVDKYPYKRPGEVRVTYKIELEHVTDSGR